MTLNQLHDFFIDECELVADSTEQGNCRSYFWRKVVWIPVSTTKIVRVCHDTALVVTHIRLCVSSDNNNSVFVCPPYGKEHLREVIAQEIATLRNS